MKIKLKKDAQLSSRDNFCRLNYEDWLDLNNGKEVEFDKVPDSILVKDKIEEVSTKKGVK